MMRAKAFLYIFCLFWTASARSSERYEFFTGIRQNGMGGASVAVVNDETALLSNPAGLGKLRSYILTILDPEISGSTNDILISSNSSNTPTADLIKPQGLLNALNASPDKHWHAKAQVFPSFVVPNFGVGVFGKYSYDAEVVSATSQYYLDYTNDLAAVLGYDVRFFDGRIKIGVSGKYINRVEAHQVLPSNSTGLEMGNLVAEGAAFAGDGGIIISGPWKLLPTIAAAIHDMGRTTFNVNNGMVYKNGVRPRDIPQTVDVALALFPIHANTVRSSITVEYQDVLTANEETDHFRRAHAGIEINFGDQIFLRGGMNQRYWTAGFEFDVRFVQIQASSYGEEIGTATAYREDRRYQGKISLRF